MGASPFRQYDRRLEILFSYFRSSCKLKSGTCNQAGLCRVLDGTAIFCRVRLHPPRQRREQERRQVDRKLRQREVEPGEVGQRADWTDAIRAWLTREIEVSSPRPVFASSSGC